MALASAALLFTISVSSARRSTSNRSRPRERERNEQPPSQSQSSQHLHAPLSSRPPCWPSGWACPLTAPPSTPRTSRLLWPRLSSAAQQQRATDELVRELFSWSLEDLIPLVQARLNESFVDGIEAELRAASTQWRESLALKLTAPDVRDWSTTIAFPNLANQRVSSAAPSSRCHGPALTGTEANDGTVTENPFRALSRYDWQGGSEAERGQGQLRGVAKRLSLAASQQPPPLVNYSCRAAARSALSRWCRTCHRAPLTGSRAGQTRGTGRTRL